MATTTLSSPIATDDLALSATVSVIEVPRDIAGSVQALYVYSATETLYQIQADGQSLADGSTAPTDGYSVIPASTQYPIPVPGHHDGITDGRPYRVALWLATGTDTLRIAPYPITR